MLSLRSLDVGDDASIAKNNLVYILRLSLGLLKLEFERVVRLSPS